jgi:hypothetical protein
MKAEKVLSKSATFLLLLIAVMSLISNFSTFKVTASPDSSFSYMFMVDQEGATAAAINFQSTDSSGSSWVIVPKDWNNTPKVSSGNISSWSFVDTREVVGESQYFYQAYKFTYQSNGFFNMTIEFSTNTGALIIDDRGIFFSPLIGFDYPSSSGTAKVDFDSSLKVNFNHVIAIGNSEHKPTQVSAHLAVFNLSEKLLRLQIELTTNLPTEYINLQSANKIFNFSAVKRYVTYASSVLNLYDRIYSNYSRLFNVTLTPPVEVQFFLPEFDEFLSIGGFTPFTQVGAGTININIFFIRAINGTIEVIAAHELVHHFLIKAGLSPNNFLWFHEGMAQYVSVAFVEKLGYEGATEEKNNLEQGSSQLIQNLGEQNLGFVQNWSPSDSPSNVENYYLASYYVVSRLAQDYDGLTYYRCFFELMHGVNVDNIDVLTLYLSKAANASVALTLQDWGFSITDLYTSSDIREKIVETQKAIAAVSPVFQPYKFLAKSLYRQALLSFKRGDNEGGTSLLQLATVIANLAPLLTLLTIAAILGIIAYLLHRHSKKAKLKPPTPPALQVPPPPPEIFRQQSSVSRTQLFINLRSVLFRLLFDFFEQVVAMRINRNCQWAEFFHFENP